ncbi:MAG TPA: ribosome maturation factor RimM [Casimicrobiaceae bacterium]
MGRVGAPHGVRGAFKVRPDSAEPMALAGYGEWLLRGRGGEWTAHRVDEVREQGDTLVAQLAGIETREAAGALRGALIGVPREWLPALEQGEYYQADLVGMAVVNREGIVLGTLREFVESGAHPIARVATDEGFERLIPWVASYVDEVDADARRISVDWPAE